MVLMNDELPDFAAINGWDTPYPRFEGPDRPGYLGSTAFGKRPLVEDDAELRSRAPDVAIVGAPFDDAVSHRPGARFGPRAIRSATYTQTAQSLQLDVDVWRSWTSSTPEMPTSCLRGSTGATR